MLRIRRQSVGEFFFLTWRNHTEQIYNFGFRGNYRLHNRNVGLNGTPKINDIGRKSTCIADLLLITRTSAIDEKRLSETLSC